MRVTIIPADGLVSIDGRGFGDIDMSSIDPSIHAVQWYGAQGEVEFVDGENGKPINERIESLDAFAAVIAQWEVKRDAEDALLANPLEPQPIKIFSVREFRARFTQQEQLDIRAASMTDHEVGLVYDEFLSAQYIDLDDPAVEQGVDLYIAKGLLDPERKTELLSPQIPQ